MIWPDTKLSHPDWIETLFPDGLDDPDTQIQPASVDLTLGSEFLVMTMPANPYRCSKRKVERAYLGEIDPRHGVGSEVFERVVCGEGEAFLIQPGEFVLGTTREVIRIPNRLVAQIEGRSSYARLGVEIHLTAGFIDPGFKGKVTLEIVNNAPRAILLWPGERICQAVFFEMKCNARRPYGHPSRSSKYQNQPGVVSSRSHMDHQAEVSDHGSEGE